MLARPAHRVLTALAVTALAGCTPEPSFQLSWSLVDEPGADASAGAVPSNAKACADVGLAQVRVTTLAGGDDLCSGTVVDERVFACLPVTGLPVEGAVLEPGAYTVVVQGLRRNGEPWSCQADELAFNCTPEPDAPACYARADFDIEVGEDGLVSGDQPELVALAKPLPCDDGIDNDRDGRVDSRDPGCFDRFQNGAIVPIAALTEDSEDGLTLFETRVSLLGAEVIQPRSLGIEYFELGYRAGPNDATTVLATVDEMLLDYTQWPFPIPLIDDSADPIAAGTYEITMTALDAGLTPLTEALEADPDGAPPTLTVDGSLAGYFLGTFSFEPGDFLAPIVQRFAFSPDLILNVNDTSPGPCKLRGFIPADPKPVPQTLDQLWIRVTDEDDQPLDAAALALTGAAGQAALAPVDEAGGWVSFACPSSNVSSQPLDWGGYTIEIQGRIGASVCFSTEGAIPLTPQMGSNAQLIGLDRLPGDGGPAACPECSTDDDCGGARVCDEASLLCVPKDPTSG